MLGSVESLDFSRDLLSEMECPACGERREVHAPPDRTSADDLLCRSCRTECVPHFCHSILPGDGLLDWSVRDVGLPAWDILWARRGDNVVGIEMAGDCPILKPPGD